MNAQEFTYWLQGFFELSESNSLTEKQVEIIKDHLKLVFTKVTPDHSKEDKNVSDFQKILEELLKKQTPAPTSPLPYYPGITYPGVMPGMNPNPLVPPYTITCGPGMPNAGVINTNYHVGPSMPSATCKVETGSAGAEPDVPLSGPGVYRSTGNAGYPGYSSGGVGSPNSDINLKATR